MTQTQRSRRAMGRNPAAGGQTQIQTAASVAQYALDAAMLLGVPALFYLSWLWVGR